MRVTALAGIALLLPLFGSPASAIEPEPVATPEAAKPDTNAASPGSPAAVAAPVTATPALVPSPSPAIQPAADSALTTLIRQQLPVSATPPAAGTAQDADRSAAAIFSPDYSRYGLNFSSLCA